MDGNFSWQPQQTREDFDYVHAHVLSSPALTEVPADASPGEVGLKLKLGHIIFHHVSPRQEELTSLC